MADKTQTIKDTSDSNLDALIVRLRKESEAQDLIRNLKLKATPNPNVSYPDFTTYEGVSTEMPIKDLYHFGIPGMKWGQHKSGGNSGGVPRRQEKSEDHVESRNLKKQNVKTLSSSELKALTNRMQLEKSLRELKMSDHQKALNVIKTATALGTTLASAYAVSQTPMGKAIKRAILTNVKRAV